MSDNKNINSANKFEFANHGERITDKKFDDKPISYLKDAWIRFRKNKASIVAACIIILIVLYAIIVPIFTSQVTFNDIHYAKKCPRGYIADGTKSLDFSEVGFIRKLAIGVGTLNYDGTPVSISDSMDSSYQPIKEVTNTFVKKNGKNEDVNYYTADIDDYLDYGFVYKSVEQSEYKKLVEWQEANPEYRLLFPLVEDNEYNPDAADANNWYKSKKFVPYKYNATTGKANKIKYDNVYDLVLEDNYKRDENGNVKYYELTGGGNFETAQYKVRILYYNYYVYQHGFEPNYFLGTDSQGYDLALRIAQGVRLSLLIAIIVSVINFILGAIYGAIEGYYGGVIDLVLERISDILNDVPFIVVATLFQIHLAKKVGPIPSLLFAYISTGWIGPASRVRTQFYRFKNQEYVMAARTLGASDRRIIWKHIFPNTLGTIITSSALTIPSVIFSESMLSFLGIVKLGGAGTTSLGTLLSDASSIWMNYPHLMIYPALVISLLMISFNLFGNGLRDAFNPSLRGVEE